MNTENDAKMQKLATEIGAVIGEEKFNVACGAVVLYLVAQTEGIASADAESGKRARHHLHQRLLAVAKLLEE